jgi:hypothetical protein
MTLGAEYILKQSKIQLSIDSNLQFKSTLETTLQPGFTLNFTAEIAQINNTYKFGYGISMMG